LRLLARPVRALKQELSRHPYSPSASSQSKLRNINDEMNFIKTGQWYILCIECVKMYRNLVY
jgi:hypothetical protein